MASENPQAEPAAPADPAVTNEDSTDSSNEEANSDARTAPSPAEVQTEPNGSVTTSSDEPVPIADAAADSEDPKVEVLRDVEFTDENVKKIWNAALAEISDMASDFASQASEVAISAPNVLAVRFLSRYNTSKTYCERPERREILEKAVSEIVGKKIHLDFSILRDDAAHEPVPRPTVKNNQQLKREITSHPMVEAAVELFDAQVSKIDPGNRSD